MALPFLRGETEENATQTLAFVSIVIITIGLAIFNICGAIVSAEPDNWFQGVIVVGFAMVITGAEFLAAVALVRVMLAKNRFRKVIGTLIFVGLAWVCIQNGKRAAYLIFPEFEQSATLLNEKAKIRKAEAEKEDAASSAAVAAIPAMLEGVQEDIAEAERKQRLLGAQSPEKIAEMQQMLITHGYYFFQVDGRIGPETERGMRSMGEDLRNDLEGLRSREANLIAGMTTVQAAEPSNDGETVLTAAGQAAVYEDQARQAERAMLWIEIMLWVVEGARSFGLWALVTTITNKSEDERRRSDAARKGWETRKSKEDAEPLKIEDEGWWKERVVKALNTHYKKPTLKGICEAYFKGVAPGELREHLLRQIERRLELPKADPVLHKRAIERGFLSSQRTTYLLQDHIDFFHSEGEYAPKPQQELNGTKPNGADDANGQDPVNNLPA